MIFCTSQLNIFSFYKKFYHFTGTKPCTNECNEDKKKTITVTKSRNVLFSDVENT